MTLYQYILLDEDRQAEEVWQGEFVTFRDEEKHAVLLYRVHGFYVEAYYDKQTNAIARFNPFNSKTRLALYFSLQAN